MKKFNRPMPDDLDIKASVPCMQVFFDICERHIQRAMEELKNRKREEGEDKTLLELFTGLHSPDGTC